MKLTNVVAFSVGLWAVAALAQQPQQPPIPGGAGRYGLPPTLPSTPLDPNSLSDEERERYERFKHGRLGPGASFEDIVALHVTPQPYPKESVVRIDDQYAMPHRAVPWKMEIVKEEGDTIWLRGLPPERPDSALHNYWKMLQKAELLVREREYHEDEAHFLDFAAEIVPPPSADAMKFVAKKTGLPAKGRWQMNFDLADMNGDGLADLVFPPERLGRAHPAIFLRDETGYYTYWTEARWTPNVPWDYGGIAVEDFDGDGDQDLVIAIHFNHQYVIYQGEVGIFGEATELPSPDKRVTSRAPAVADFDGDGTPDVAFLAELNYDVNENAVIPGASTVWVALNRGQEWELQTAGLPGMVIGDTIAAADVDRDGRVDLVLGSNSTDYRSLVWLNRAKGWQEAYQGGVLSNGWHFQVVPEVPAEGPVLLYAAFNQFMMVGSDNRSRTGIIRYTVSDGAIDETFEPLVMADAKANTYFRLASGDLNGDGRTDLVAGRNHGGLEIYLQGDNGELVLERSPEMEAVGRPFHIMLEDLDGDGLDDIIASFALRDPLIGGVRVWLSRSTT